MLHASLAAGTRLSGGTDARVRCLFCLIQHSRQSISYDRRASGDGNAIGRVHPPLSTLAFEPTDLDFYPRDAMLALVLIDRLIDRLIDIKYHT